jgi:hypothetical protein
MDDGLWGAESENEGECGHWPIQWDGKGQKIPIYLPILLIDKNSGNSGMQHFLNEQLGK